MLTIFHIYSGILIHSSYADFFTFVCTTNGVLVLLICDGLRSEVSLFDSIFSSSFFQHFMLLFSLSCLSIERQLYFITFISLYFYTSSIFLYTSLLYTSLYYTSLYYTILHYTSLCFSILSIHLYVYSDCLISAYVFLNFCHCFIKAVLCFEGLQK